LIRQEFSWIKELVEIILLLVQDQELFLTLSIHDILWGYEDNLLKKVKEVAADLSIHLDLDDHFGLFYNVSLISFILIFLFKYICIWK